MPTSYTVERGDCLASIAKKFGFRSWRAIYDDPNNADFKKARPDPNVIYPGDVLLIPDPKPSTKTAPGKVEKLNRFKVTLEKTLLRIQVKDEEEKPLAGKSYELRLGSNDVRRGATDGDGIVEVKVEPTVTQAKLLVFDGDPKTGPLYVWDVAIGHLNPADTPSGAKARLNNLGYFCGDVDEAADSSEEIDPLTKLALAGFQEANGLERSGKLDEATQKKLVEIHGTT
jgi:LysM repeat protein